MVLAWGWLPILRTVLTCTPIALLLLASFTALVQEICANRRYPRLFHKIVKDIVEHPRIPPTDERCPICFNDDSTDLVRLKACGHYYCMPCLETVLPGRNSCCLCMKKLTNGLCWRDAHEEATRRLREQDKAITALYSIDLFAAWYVVLDIMVYWLQKLLPSSTTLILVVQTVLRGIFACEMIMVLVALLELSLVRRLHGWLRHMPVVLGIAALLVNIESLKPLQLILIACFWIPFVAVVSWIRPSQAYLPWLRRGLGG